MTKEQKAEALRLMTSMPFLGGRFIPMNDDDFATGLLANLEELQQTLKCHAKRHNNLVKEVQEYRGIFQTLKSIAKLITD